jgi:DNA-directed RNA polymerase beta subunit
MTFNENQDHSISLNDASQMTAAYRGTITSGEPIAAAFTKKSIEDIINQQSCVGLRMYYALDASGTLTLVLVGIKSDGDDIIGGQIAQWGQQCPPFCGVQNQLNS